MTPEEAEAYLNEIRMKKKDKTVPKPPTNLQSSEINDWYSQQRKMHLDEQKKRIEAVRLYHYVCFCAFSPPFSYNYLFRHILLFLSLMQKRKKF